MFEVQKMTRKQWILMGIAIVLDIVLVLLGLYFSPIITEIFANDIFVPLFFDGCVVLLMIISTLVIVRIANKKQ